MPRRNRNIAEPHRKHRRGRLIPLSGQQVFIRTMNPRPGEFERGSAVVKSVVNLLLVIALVITGTMLTLAVFAPEANARAVQVEQPDHEVIGRDDVVLYVGHVIRKWHYVEIADGSTWMVTRCKNDEIPTRHTSCWWNAHAMGNHQGRSFLALHGTKYRVVRGTVIVADVWCGSLTRWFPDKDIVNWRLV